MPPVGSTAFHRPNGPISSRPSHTPRRRRRLQTQPTIPTSRRITLATRRHLRHGPLTDHPSIISREDQETACRDYCTSKGLSVAATFADQAGAGDQFDEMIAQATGPEAPFYAIVVWKLHRFSNSLEDTIAYRDRLRQTRTKLLSATERGIDD